MKKLMAFLLAGIVTLASAETIYRSDFKKSPKPLSVWGKVADGVLSANGRYDFAGMTLNPSKKDLTLSCTFKTDADTSLGI